MLLFRSWPIVFLLLTANASADVIANATTAITLEYQNSTSSMLMVSVEVMPPLSFGFSDGDIVDRTSAETTLLAAGNPTSNFGPLLNASTAANVATLGNALPASGDGFALQELVLNFINPNSESALVTIGGTVSVAATTTSDEPSPSFAIADASIEFWNDEGTVLQRSSISITDDINGLNPLFEVWTLDLTVPSNGTSELNLTLQSFASATSVPVPEPNTTPLLLLALLAATLRRELFS